MSLPRWPKPELTPGEINDIGCAAAEELERLAKLNPEATSPPPRAEIIQAVMARPDIAAILPPADLTSYVGAAVDHAVLQVGLAAGATLSR